MVAAATTQVFEVEEPESTLTDRYQTTVPTAVRKALGLGKGDRIHYRVLRRGEVIMRKAERPAEGEDPALRPFLAFIAKDIHDHPGRLRGIDAGLIARARALTAGVVVDREASLDPDDE